MEKEHVMEKLQWILNKWVKNYIEMSYETDVKLKSCYMYDNNSIICEFISNWWRNIKLKRGHWCAYRMVNNIGYVHIIVKCRNHDEVDTYSVRDLVCFYRYFF